MRTNTRWNKETLQIVQDNWGKLPCWDIAALVNRKLGEIASSFMRCPKCGERAYEITGHGGGGIPYAAARLGLITFETAEFEAFCSRREWARLKHHWLKSPKCLRCGVPIGGHFKGEAPPEGEICFYRIYQKGRCVST